VSYVKCLYKSIESFLRVDDPVAGVKGDSV